MTSLHSSPSTPLRREFLPPMGALLAFESAARNASISRAAEELHLTQSAVSRQILNLEEQLGTALFQRVRQRVILTDAGREFAAELRSGLACVAQATQRVMTLGGVKDVLNIAVLPMFATRWLIPRMDRFAARLPAVLVNYASRTEPFDFRKESFDVAIHYGEPFWPDGDGTFVLSESVLPVCSPKFKALNKVRSKADIGKHTLLQQTTRPTHWSEWFDEARMSTAGAMRGPR